MSIFHKLFKIYWSEPNIDLFMTLSLIILGSTHCATMAISQEITMQHVILNIQDTSIFNKQYYLHIGQNLTLTCSWDTVSHLLYWVAHTHHSNIDVIDHIARPILWYKQLHCHVRSHRKLVICICHIIHHNTIHVLSPHFSPSAYFHQKWKCQHSTHSNHLCCTIYHNH